MQNYFVKIKPSNFISILEGVLVVIASNPLVLQLKKQGRLKSGDGRLECNSCINMY